MKFVALVVASMAATLSSLHAVDSLQQQEADAATGKIEEGSFWQRFVQEASSMSIATPAPVPLHPSSPPHVTAVPSPGATPSATAVPTPGATQSATAVPTPGATPSSTSAPTTPPPSPPSPNPTAAPSPLIECEVDVSISCATGGGGDCKSIGPKSPQSCTDNHVDILTFLFINCTCGCSDNKQGSAAGCESSKPFDASPVSIKCIGSDETEMNVVPTVVAEGLIFEVENPAGDPLPNTLTCTFSQSGVIIQTITVDVSGASPLDLLDKFGAAQVVSCDSETCLEELCYTYKIENVGTSPMNLTKADRVYNGVTASFLDVINITTLDVGKSVSVGECRNISVCNDLISSTEVYIEADSPSGLTCLATDNYLFSFKVPQTPAPVPAPTPRPTAVPTATLTCELNADMQCATKVGGKGCDTLERKTPETCSSPLTELQFLFTNCTCACSDNEQGGMETCTQFLSFNFEAVNVTCTDGDNNAMTVVTPASGLVEGRLFSVTNPSGGVLPATIVCSFSQSNGTVQTVTIGTGSDTTLRLQDKFGGSQVVSCDEDTCLEEICYLYSIENTGSTSVNLTRADRIFNGKTDSFLGAIEDKTLIPGQRTNGVKECRPINVCSKINANNQILAEAEPNGGETCQAEASYSFSIS